MVKKLTFDDTEYEYDKLTEHAKAAIKSLKFSERRINELCNIRALLERAKKSYIDSLKKEMISDKAGIVLEDD